MTGGLSGYLDFAGELADAAARVTLRHFRAGGRIRNKQEAEGGFDPLAPADIQAERAMRRLIEERYPAHGIEGEEMPPRPAQPGAPGWVLDPIDGTRNYIAGSLFWSTLIGLNAQGEPRAGLIDHPATGERFAAQDGQGWWRRARQRRALAARKCARLEEAFLGATTPDLFRSAGETEAFREISARARLTLYGGNAYFYGLIALGQMDLVVESSLTRFDVQALIPVVRAAGGVITDWRGGDPQNGGQVAAAGDPALHEQALEILEKA